MTPFDAIAVLPSAEIYVSVELAPTNADGAAVPYRVTTAPFLFTEPGDTPSNTLFRSLMMEGWSTSRRLSARGTFLDASDHAVAAFVLDNSRGTFDGWKALKWNSSPVTMRLGGRIRADGSVFPWADYQVAFDGVVDAASPAGKNQLEVAIAGRKLVFKESSVREVYRALGGAVLSPDGNQILDASPDAALDNTFPQSWEIFGRVVALPAVEARLFSRGDSNIGLVVAADGEISILTPGFARTATGYNLEVGVFYVGLAVDAGGESATLFAGRDGNDVDEVWTGAIPTATNAGSFKMNRISGVNHMAVEFWEVRQHDRAITRDDVLLRVDGPIPVSAADLLEVVRFGDRQGTLANGINGLLELDISDGGGGGSWVDSMTGDDPIQYGGALLGQSVQEVVGDVFNAPLIAVATRGHHWHASRRWSAGSEFRRLRVKGAPLWPRETLTAISAGDISIANDVLTFVAPLSGHRFVEGQEDPPREGQRIEIASQGAPWDGVYIVDVDGVADDGSTVALLDESGGAAGLPDQSFAAGAVVKTPDDEWQWEQQDLTRAIITTRFVPDGEPTWDGRGGLPSSGVARFVDVLGMLLDETLGVTLDSDAITFDPLVGYVLRKDAAPTLEELITKLARSAWAWWVEKRDGTFRTGTWLLPSGTPVATIATSSRYLIPGASAPLTGRVVNDSFEEVPTEDPAWRFDVVHSRNWSKQDPGSLVGSVSPAMKERLTAEWLHAIPWTDPRNRRDFRAVEPAEPFETYLVNADEAEQLKQLAVPFVGQKRRQFETEVAGLPLLSLELNDVVLVEHPDSTFELESGSLCRVMAIDEESDTDVTALELFN